MFQAIQFNENPYTWTESAEEVTTGVSQLQLKRGEDVLNVDDLDKPVEIIIPVAATDYVTVNITLQENYTTIVEFNKTSDQSLILMFLDGTGGDLPENAMLDFAIYDFSFSDLLVPDEEVLPVYDDSFIIGYVCLCA